MVRASACSDIGGGCHTLGADQEHTEQHPQPEWGAGQAAGPAPHSPFPWLSRLLGSVTL